MERQKYSKILQEAEDYCQSGNLQRAVGILEYGRDTAKDSDTRSMFIEKIQSIYNEINNQQADRYYNKAEDCYRSGYYSDAIDYYEKAIDVTNDSRMIEY